MMSSTVLRVAALPSSAQRPLAVPGVAEATASAIALCTVVDGK
jgi:hypothetical protein